MLKWLLLLLVIVCVIVVAEWMREIHTFQNTHYDIQSPKLKNVKKRKIILLSDLHNCSYGKENEKLLKAVQNEKPDIVIVILEEKHKKNFGVSDCCFADGGFCSAY